MFLGIVIGVVAVFAGGIILFQVLGGEDAKSKLHYLINEGKDRLKIFNQKATARNPSKSLVDKKDEYVSNLRLDINVSKPIRSINPMIYGSNLSAKTEFEMEVANFGKDIGITNFRFPGGDSDGYRWKLATFDFEDRFNHAPLSNIENVIKFSGIANAKLVIQVNIESGTPQEAAEWVAYMNKGNGVRVDYWELGNEAYGNWDNAYMSGDDYVKTIKQYSTLMKRADPTIKIGANWGGIKYNEFDKAIMQKAADHIDFVSYHWYPNHISREHRYKERTHPSPKEIMANGLAVDKIVKRFEQMVIDYAPHRKGKIEFTMMEWDGSWDAVATNVYAIGNHTFSFFGKIFK